ncbi:FecCD family ABC transporter permease [Caldimonas tepidiphila]|uniref:FecCD family ABC transporter permease n=1 Tax=Caldimonas tepidiphila TaxID=2315841 RepID=UPI001F0BE263|nr:iron ABC transporter permease [Caldimonas tepidiphila]
MRGVGLGLLLAGSVALLLLGVAIGSTGWSPPWGGSSGDAVASQILWEIRAPRSLGAWLAGALLGLGGAIAQGLFRNPLADPYLLGSASGATLGVALLLAAVGASPAATAWALKLGLTAAAFLGAVLAVWMTLALARGVQHTLRLLLAGVIVGVVLAAVKDLALLSAPDILRPMQAFMLGTTGFLGWSSVAVLAMTLAACLAAGIGCSRALDALTLGESAAASLGVRLKAVRVLLVATLALATGAAVAQAGLIAFVGLVAPHLVRSVFRVTHAALLLLSAIAGGLLLLAADIAARWALAPQELPVGVLTAVFGGGYLLWRMHRGPKWSGA